MKLKEEKVPSCPKQKYNYYQLWESMDKYEPFHYFVMTHPVKWRLTVSHILTNKHTKFSNSKSCKKRGSYLSNFEIPFSVFCTKDIVMSLYGLFILFQKK